MNAVQKYEVSKIFLIVYYANKWYLFENTVKL